MMFITSAKLSALVLLAIPDHRAAARRVSAASVRRLSREAQDTLGDASAYASENLSAYRTMQAYVNEKGVSDRLPARSSGRSTRRASGCRRGAALTGIAIFPDGRERDGRALVWCLPRSSPGNMTGGRLGQFVALTRSSPPARSPKFSEVWGRNHARRLAPPNGFRKC